MAMQTGGSDGILGKATLKVGVLFQFSLQCCDGSKPRSWFEALALSLVKETTSNSASPSMQGSVPLSLEAVLVKPPLNRSKFLLTSIICII